VEQQVIAINATASVPADSAPGDGLHPPSDNAAHEDVVSESMKGIAREPTIGGRMPTLQQRTSATRRESKRLSLTLTSDMVKNLEASSALKKKDDDFDAKKTIDSKPSFLTPIGMRTSKILPM
jgi:hypothetical protein